MNELTFHLPNEGHYSSCMEHPFSPDNELANLDQMVAVP
jgi:hypothetical protein